MSFCMYMHNVYTEILTCNLRLQKLQVKLPPVQMYTTEFYMYIHVYEGHYIPHVHVVLNLTHFIHTSCIMQRVVELSKEYLPQFSCGFSDTRVSVHCEDGAEFMTRHKNKFDVIITDSSDPIGREKTVGIEVVHRLLL